MKYRVGRVPVSTAAQMTLPFLIMGVCLWLLAGIVDISVFSGLFSTIVSLPLIYCVLAAGLCALSLWAVARYDGLAHRHFQTGINEAIARKSGFAAIAIAQTVGFGVVTGAAVRWRMLPDLGLTDALKLSTFVSVTFLAALGFIAALVCLLLPPAPWMILPALALVLGLPLCLIGLSFGRVTAPLRHRIKIPSLRSSAAILGWSGLDLIAAALALFLLIPASELSFFVFLPVFLLALGAALLSGAPGGVGPFELTLITMLPQVPAADLVAAIVVFRALYYGVPAVVAVVVIFTAKRLGQAPVARHNVRLAPVAELGIMRQNHAYALRHENGALSVWQTPQSLTQLFDPVSGPASDAVNALTTAAQAANRLPCIYKCSARTAIAARAKGWQVARIAQDCILPVQSYDLNSATRRGLRRKLRKAKKSGVTVALAADLPLAEMAKIDAAWQNAHGTVRGGTMGRFCRDYVAYQDVFLAHQDGRLIAYITLHRHATAPCLDLMRHLPNVADGTMHLLVQTAIDTAKQTGKTDLSLAAYPDMPAWTARTGPLARHFIAPGLAQFKHSFAPQLRPRFAAAPSRAALAIALADITAEVHWPAPLPNTHKTHHKDEDYEVALNAAPWLSTLYVAKTGS